jgi:ACS family pantothenate transporter-like MFS transporter
MGKPQAATVLSAVPRSPTCTIQNHDDDTKKSHKWYYYLWDTLDKPKEERWFMFKLDAALLTFASLGKPGLYEASSEHGIDHGRVFHQEFGSVQH